MKFNIAENSNYWISDLNRKSASVGVKSYPGEYLNNMVLYLDDENDMEKVDQFLNGLDQSVYMWLHSHGGKLFIVNIKDYDFKTMVQNLINNYK